MKIKKFTAPSMKEALLQIKQELGEEAVILKTRKVPGKMFSLGPHNEIEVTAALDETAVKNPAGVKPLQFDKTGTYNRPVIKKKDRGAAEPAGSAFGSGSFRKSSGAGGLELLKLSEDISEIKDLLETIIKKEDSSSAGGFTGAWAVLYRRLVDAEVEPELSHELILEIKGDKEVPDRETEKSFVEVLSRRFSVSGAVKTKQDSPVIVSFVGPTGTGKTTTIAKLAANYCLEENLDVSLITIDTYRIAAIEQIRAFADIVNIGLQVVFSPEEVSTALEACENDDIVFVDTAGRSQKNSEHMHELADYLDELNPHEVHLVLSATTKESDLNTIIRRYRKMGANRLLFTKIDETMKLGNIYNVSNRHQIPVSYFTNGQAIPDDIEIAQAGRFVQKLWSGSSL